MIPIINAYGFNQKSKNLKNGNGKNSKKYIDFIYYKL